MRVDGSARRYGVGARSSGQRSPGLRTAGLAAGLCLAVGATGVIFLTENPQVLRLAVVAAAWAFVLAALVASHGTADRSPVDDGEQAAAVRRAGLDRAAAAEREAELRPAPELAREREAAAQREHELRVDDELRSAAERSMRAELEALHGELTQVARLREELAQVTELRRELAEVALLRRDLAGIAELRTTLAGLNPDAPAEPEEDPPAPRHSPARGGALQAAREPLPSELTEQLSSGMLVERVLLRTRATRTTAAASEPAAGPHPVEEVRVEPRRVALPPPPWGQAAGRTGADAPSPPYAESEPRRRRTDGPAPMAVPLPAEELTVERPAARPAHPPMPGPAAPTAGSPAPVRRDEATPLAQLIAESGLTPPSGGRRRRRYREDDESDDVLARVLGR